MSRPLPAWLHSFKGDGRWDDEHYGQAPGHRYCCFPDCAWLMTGKAVACVAHTDLVGPERVRAVESTTDEFDREMAVDLLRQEMVEAQDARMFG
ncbi:MAG: hypothetical protein V4787_11565 [Pseudomonadota bacterium]